MNASDVLSDSQDIFKIFNILRRRKLSFIIPFIIVAPAIIAGGMFLPKLYRAETTILVEPQKVPSHYVQSIVTVPIEQRLNTITQQIMSRSRLLKIIRELNLADDNISPLGLEEMIDSMQEQIEVEVKGTSYFQIVYSGKDPQTVMLVANKIASLFIEENLRVSERQARTTTSFLSEELEKVQHQLEAQEQKLQEFKQQHMGELPAQEEANLRTLDRLQLQLQNIDQALRDTEEQEMFLQKQLLEEKPFETLETQMLTRREIRQNPLLTKLVQLKERLDILRMRYSDEWPGVKQTKEEIARLEVKLSEAEPSEEEPSEEEPGKEKYFSKTTLDNPIYKTVKENLEKTRRKIYSLKGERTNLLNQISFYRKRVEGIPGVEQELIGLTRDYEMTKNKYESLLNKKLEAKLAESLEAKQKGETFKILDAAEIPLLPYEPNFIKIIALAIGMGMVLGAGMVWLREDLDHSLREIDDTENYFGTTVIGIISNIVIPADIKRNKRRKRILIFFFILYITTLFKVVGNRTSIKQYFSSVKSHTGSSPMFRRN